MGMHLLLTNWGVTSSEAIRPILSDTVSSFIERTFSVIYWTFKSTETRKVWDTKISNFRYPRYNGACRAGYVSTDGFTARSDAHTAGFLKKLIDLSNQYNSRSQICKRFSILDTAGVINRISSAYSIIWQPRSKAHKLLSLQLCSKLQSTWSVSLSICPSVRLLVSPTYLRSNTSTADSPVANLTTNLPIAYRSRVCVKQIIANPNRVLAYLLADKTDVHYDFRPRRHYRQLLPKRCKLYDSIFIVRMLY